MGHERVCEPLTTARKPRRPDAGILPQAVTAVGFTRWLGADWYKPGNIGNRLYREDG